MYRPPNGQRTRLRSALGAASVATCLVVSACTTGNSTQAGPAASTTQRATTTLRSAAPEQSPTSEAPTTSAAVEETTTTTEATPATPSTTVPGQVTSGGPDFTLVNAGSEPRQLLRYDVEATTVTQSVVETQLISQQIERVPDLIDIASSLVTDFETQIVPDPGGSGNYELISTPTDVRANGTDQPSIDAADLLRDPFSQIQTRVTINDRGIKLATSVTGTEALVALGPEFEALVADLDTLEMGAVPLPDVPVGLGARWNVTTDLMITGFRVIQTVTYEVTAIDGSTIELEISGSQVSNSQSVPNPAQIGSEISVEAWDITIEGSASVDLTRLVNPLEQRVGGSQTLIVSQGAIETKVDQAINSEVIVIPLS